MLVVNKMLEISEDHLDGNELFNNWLNCVSYGEVQKINYLVGIHGWTG